MRRLSRLSLGALLLLLFLAGTLFGGPFSKPAAAQAGITIGFAIGSSGLTASSEQGEELGRYLADHLTVPVRVRTFASEEQLYTWLSRFHEVDVAWLSKDFLDRVPAGQIYPLARALDLSGELVRGDIVARQGLTTLLQEQLGSAFLAMQENAEGRRLLVRLDTSRFVGPGLWQPPTWEDVAEAQPLVSAASSAPLPVEPAQAVSPPALPSPPHFAVTAEQSAPPEREADRPGSSAGVVATEETQSPISLVADYLAYDSNDDSYEARGDVILRQDDIELSSQELLWQAATQDAAAQGAVQLHDADTEVSAASMQYNLATGQGQLREGQIFVREGNFHLAGEQIEKRGQAEYFVRQGSFTTCDGEIPDWKFSASEVDVTLGGYARAKHVLFHVRDVPVLYVPYLMFPVKTERESGLLTPSFGHSNNKGAKASLAWYQVIDRSMDATVYLDYLSEIGLGKGLEYRYALTGRNEGQALYYHVDGLKENPDVYYLEWQHRGRLPGGWRLAADVEYADDRFFFEEFGEVAEDYNRDKTVSTLTLQHNWQKLNLVGHARYIQDLATDNDTTLQRLPELSLGLARYRLGDSPFYAGLESYATRFSRDEGEDGERLFLKPSLSAVFTPGSWLEIVPQVALYERLYDVDDKDDEMFVPEFSLGLTTRMVKSFTVDRWGIDRLQHSVEPKVVYTYTPHDSQDDLPLFDLHDRVERLQRNALTFALVNRLTARSTAADGSRAYREIFNLRLSQSYDIDEARNNRSGQDRPFGDVRAEMVVRPTRNLALDVDSRIPVHGDTRLHTLSGGVSARDGGGNAANFSYTYKDEEFAGTATDYLGLQLDTSLLKPVYVRFEERYDFSASRELEKVLGLEYRAKCWSLFLSYRNRYREDGDDHEFMVSFVLAGLGQNQGFGSGF